MALPSGKKPAALSDLGIVAIGELSDEVVRERYFRGILNLLKLLLPGSMFPFGTDQTLLDVVEYGAAKQDRFLGQTLVSWFFPRDYLVCDAYLLHKAHRHAKPIKVVLVNRATV